MKYNYKLSAVLIPLLLSLCIAVPAFVFLYLKTEAGLVPYDAGVYLLIALCSVPFGILVYMITLRRRRYVQLDSGSVSFHAVRLKWKIRDPNAVKYKPRRGPIRGRIEYHPHFTTNVTVMYADMTEIRLCRVFLFRIVEIEAKNCVSTLRLDFRYRDKEDMFLRLYKSARAMNPALRVNEAFSDYLQSIPKK